MFVYAEVASLAARQRNSLFCIVFNPRKAAANNQTSTREVVAHSSPARLELSERYVAAPAGAEERARVEAALAELKQQHDVAMRAFQAAFSEKLR